MSTTHVTRLPDPVYGSCDAHTSDHHRLSIKGSEDGSTLIHVFLGGVYVAMTERNWQNLFAAITQVDIVAPPVKTHRIHMNDTDRTATTETVTS